MSISEELKKRIDDWIARTGLNQYGDPPHTFYPGGSPLFNERTGQQQDRYEYILSRHPELRENRR